MQPTVLRTSCRDRLVVVVLALDQERAQDESERWRSRGAVVVQASDAGGCLRVATSVRPHVIVLDRGVPKRLVQVLKAHPVSARADIQWMAAERSGVEYQAA